MSVSDAYYRVTCNRWFTEEEIEPQVFYRDYSGKTPMLGLHDTTRITFVLLSYAPLVMIQPKKTPERNVWRFAILHEPYWPAFSRSQYFW